MNPDDQKNQRNDDSALDDLEQKIGNFFRESPVALPGLLVITVVVIASPLVLFWTNNNGKDWSEVVKNGAESCAVLTAGFAVIKWVYTRRDRATDVLLNLEKEFKDNDVLPGRDLIEDDAFWAKSDGDFDVKRRDQKLDKVLRFYVILYGVYLAKQVPEKSLSICFRYWLAHYFRKDRIKFRDYVDVWYPNLHAWLRGDCRQGCRFFIPQRLFQQHTDVSFIERCSKGEEA